MKMTARLTKAERCDLASDAYRAVLDGFESFSEDGVGVDLAYLMGAICKGGDAVVDWADCESPRPIVWALREKFPKDSPLWDFIVLDEDKQALGQTAPV